MQALARDADEAAGEARDAVARRRAGLGEAAPLVAPSSASADVELLAEFTRSDFDPIAFINRRFPTEHSLSAAEDVSVMLRGITLKLEYDMQRAVWEQAKSKDRGQRELGAAKSAIHGLFDRIQQIQLKARHTEATVEGICGGIRKLDAAKQNLTSTVTALRRLQMLVQAVDQLERSTGSRQYSEAPGLLDATNQLAQQFERFRKVPKIAELQGKIENTVKVLRRQVLSDIKRVIGDHDRFFDDEKTRSDTRYANVPALHHKALADACSVVEALDPKCREELVTWFCHQQLQEYSTMFCEETSIAYTEKRYSWMRRYLESYDERYGEVFPPTWNVAPQLCLTFCQTTREQLGESIELSRVRAGEGCDVNVLVRAVELAIKAEQWVDDTLARTEATLHSSATTEVVEADGSFSRQPMIAPEWTSFADSCPISAGFEEALLVVYIEKQVHDFQGLLATCHKEERWRVDGDDEMDSVSPLGERTSFVLDSARELVMAIKESMTQCQALSVRETFLDLLRIFKDTFRLYGTKLLQAKLETQPAARRLAVEITAGSVTEGDTLGAQQADESDLDISVDVGGQDNAVGETEPGASGASEDLEDRLWSTMFRKHGSFKHAARAAFDGAAFYSDKAKEVAMAKGAAVQEGMQVGKTAAFTAAAAAAARAAIPVTSSLKQTEDFDALEQLEPTVLGLACTTAEYCSNSLGQLADSYRKRIVPALANQIDVEPEQEVFAGVASEAIRLLVAHVEVRTAPLFDSKMFASIIHEAQAGSGPAAAEEDASANMIHSTYMGDVAHELAEFATTERRLLSSVHYRYLCDRVVTALIARFTRGLHKCKPLHTAGLEQVLVDCTHLENVLLALHWVRPTDLTADGSLSTAAGHEERSVARSFERLVKREMQRPKALLQLVPVPAKQLVEKFAATVPNGSVVDLQHVMELQGVAGATQQALLSAFGRLKRSDQTT